MAETPPCRVCVAVRGAVRELHRATGSGPPPPLPPGNVVLTEEGEVPLCDEHLARVWMGVSEGIEVNR